MFTSGPIKVRNGEVRFRKEEFRAWKEDREVGRRENVSELKLSLNKIEEMKGKIERLESALQNCELRIEQLEAREEHWKEELHHSYDQVRSRDYLMGKAIVQIREVVDHLQTLAAQADILSMKYKLQSDRGQELTSLYARSDAEVIGKAPTRNEGPNVGRSEKHDGSNGLDDEWGNGQRKGSPRSNPGDNPTNLVILDLDIAERKGIRTESSRQLEDRCRWLEEKFKALENADHHHGIDAKDLNLVSDLLLPHKFKMLEFEKYNRTSCPEAHITMFCRRMTGYVNNDQLLIHYFRDSLVGPASRWYNQLSRARISSWKDLAQAFMKQYNHVTNMTPDRITLQNMEKKSNESFRQYEQRWREVAMQVQPPLLENETTMLFINTLKAPFITHMIGSTTKSFVDIVMTGEMIENAIRGGKIEVGETTKRSTPRKKDDEVNNTSTYNKGYSRVITVNQPKVITAGRQRSGTRQNSEKLQFMPIPMTYKELYQSLFDAHMVSPFYLKPLQPPFPKWYNENAQCEYHARIKCHSIENCTTFKQLVERFIKRGIVKFDDSSKPDYFDEAVNAIIEGGDKRDFEDDSDCNLSSDLLIMVEQDEKQTLLYKRSVDIMRGHAWATKTQAKHENRALLIYIERDGISYAVSKGDKIHVPSLFLHKFSIRGAWM
ncbi:hypothetical protein EPI10_023399 [Gossypium australe]|uniref:Retrotransposon gag domain-containing protein n=1 Tax=Gossypium australe TaxID=47621 RepID=A0A5B6VVH4_9ROSI|nr:hypothetical protein EPI10_023399 [Gossypium australe]